MKKKINFLGILTLVIIATLVFLPISCNKDRSQVNEDHSENIIHQAIKVSGTDTSSVTKTTLNGLVTTWVASSDRVGIYSPQARPTSGGSAGVNNTPFTASASAKSSDFTGSMFWGDATTHLFYSYYPYAAGTPSSGVIPLSLPAAQTQSSANSTAHIGALDFMVATPVSQSPGTTGDQSTINFKYNHVFTVLEFQIKGTGSLKAVKLVGTGNPLAFSSGTIDITQATPSSGVAYTISGRTGTTTQAVVTLTTPATLTSTNTDTKVYMVINPGTQTGDCLIGLSTDGTTWSYISKASPSGGFLRGMKYVVSIDKATAGFAPAKDPDGNVFNIVTIGTQVWMAENLKTTKYNDGTSIPNITIDATWGALTTAAYCDYSNNSSNSTTYGRLYNWYAVDNNAATKVASNGGKNICPVGWHVPSYAEWSTLITYLVNNQGYKLKEAGTTHWIAPNNANNSSGFTALPGGYRNNVGTFYSIFSVATFWNSTESTATSAKYRYISNELYTTYDESNPKQFGSSVRCLRD